MSTRKAAAVVAGLLIAVGLVVGLLPHEAVDPNLGVEVPCGSAFFPNGTFDRACESALSAPRWAGLAFGIPGLLAGVFLLLTMQTTEQSAARS